MKYEQWIKQLKNMPEDKASDRVWHRISVTLDQKKQSVFWEIPLVFRNMVLTGALAGLLVLTGLGIHQHLVRESYMQMLGSTEYIYDICKYNQ